MHLTNSRPARHWCEPRNLVLPKPQQHVELILKSTVQALWADAEQPARQAALRIMAQRELTQDAAYAECVVQVLQALKANMGVAVLGPSGCGKSTCLQICQVRLVLQPCLNQLPLHQVPMQASGQA